MDNLTKLTLLINEIYEFSNEGNLVNTFQNIINKSNKLKEENELLKKELQEKDNIILKINTDYNNNIENKNKEISLKSQELENLSKVSLIVSMNKELDTKKKYIEILESQLEKCRRTHSNTATDSLVLNDSPKHTLVDNTIIEEYTNTVEVEVPVEKKVKKKKNKDFDPDNFEEINGYELIIYKKKYYLRDLETDELYDIVENKPNIIVGLITPNGKPKFN